MSAVHAYPRGHNCENAAVIGAAYAYDAACNAAERKAEIRASLRREMLDALQKNASAVIPTPAWGAARCNSPASEVIADDFAGMNSEALLVELLRIVGLASLGFDVKEPALRWIEARADEYATNQADDAAWMWEGIE